MLINILQFAECLWNCGSASRSHSQHSGVRCEIEFYCSFEEHRVLDVTEFEEEERDRPQFRGTLLRPSPVTGEVSIMKFYRQSCQAFDLRLIAAWAHVSAAQETEAVGRLVLDSDLNGSACRCQVRACSMLLTCCLKSRANVARDLNDTCSCSIISVITFRVVADNEWTYVSHSALLFSITPSLLNAVCRKQKIPSAS